MVWGHEEFQHVLKNAQENYQWTIKIKVETANPGLPRKTAIKMVCLCAQLQSAECARSRDTISFK